MQDSAKFTSIAQSVISEIIKYQGNPDYQKFFKKSSQDSDVFQFLIDHDYKITEELSDFVQINDIDLAKTKKNMSDTKDADADDLDNYAYSATNYDFDTDFDGEAVYWLYDKNDDPIKSFDTLSDLLKYVKTNLMH